MLYSFSLLPPLPSHFTISHNLSNFLYPYSAHQKVIRQCDSVLVVAPPLPLLVPPLCPKGHVLPQEVDNDDDDEAVTTATTSPTMPTSNISSSNAVPAYVARKLAAAPSGSVPEKGVKSSSLQNTSSQKGEEVKDSISTDETTVVENESR